VRRIGLLMGWTETDPEVQPRLAAFMTAFRELGWIEGQNCRIELRWSDGEVEHAITTFAHQSDGGLIVFPHTITATNRNSIVELAAKHRLPAVYPLPFFARAGGLLSYGIDQIEQWRPAARYVDRILRGEKPADLPVQAPSKFELVINLKTAKALGLDVPLHLQQLANEVIE
jgi:putative tryptophan/tyrosine transport system substrate-binding protein